MSKNKNRDLDYLHAGARVNYLENHLITFADLQKALDAQNAEEAWRGLSGKELLKNFDITEMEEAFLQNQSKTYEMIETLTQNSGITNVFRYHIDGHNLKVLIKSEVAKGTFEEIYKTGGTIDIESMKQEFFSKKFEQIPQSLGEAAVLAYDSLAKNSDSQNVEIIIDKAIMNLMSEKAKELEIPAIYDYARMIIDLTNIKIYLRLLRMQKDIFDVEKMLLVGGTLKVESLKDAYSSQYKGLIDLSSELNYGQHLKTTLTAIKDGGSLSLFEQEIDRCRTDFFKMISRKPFGIEPIISFLYKKEREIRTVRLVLIAKLYELPKKEAAERLRYIYED